MRPALSWSFLPRARALAACALLLPALPSPAADAPAPALPPLPVASFFQLSRIGEAVLSPDGRHVAMTVASGGNAHLGLAVIDLPDMKTHGVTALDDLDISGLHWVNDKRLVYSSTQRGTPQNKFDGAPGLFAVNLDGSGFRQLVNRHHEWVRNGQDRPLLPWNTYFLQTIGRQTGDEVYVTSPEEIDVKHADYFKLQKLNTLSGNMREVPTPAHAFDWTFDPEGELRVVVTSRNAHNTVLARQPGSEDWKPLAAFDSFSDDEGFSPAYVDQDGRLFITSHQGRNTRAIFTYDLAKGLLEPKPFLASEQYDLEPLMLSQHGKLAGLRYQVDASVTQWLDPALQKLQAEIDQRLPTTSNRISVASRGDGRFVLVHAASDRVPGLWLLFDTEQHKLSKLGSEQPGIDPRRMAAMDLVHYPARDGLDIPAWLTLPPNPAPGLPAGAKPPLVVLVHGGPYVRGGDWRWDPEVQFLASRGYAVLQPEFRGSTGFGARHYQAGWKQWGLAMQDDIADGVRWAAAQGKVDGTRVCIAGASYGGYATLMGLIRDPDLYRCGVEWVGVTDINLMYTVDWSDMGDTWKRHGMPKLVGDPVKDAAQLQATSPIEQAARIRKPLLMAYGESDLRVPLIHGEKLRDALKRQPGAQVEWVTYADEGHGWRSTENQVDFWTRVEAFLAKHLAP